MDVEADTNSDRYTFNCDYKHRVLILFSSKQNIFSSVFSSFYERLSLAQIG